MKPPCDYREQKSEVCRTDPPEPESQGVRACLWRLRRLLTPDRRIIRRHLGATAEFVSASGPFPPAFVHLDLGKELHYGENSRATQLNGAELGPMVCKVGVEREGDAGLGLHVQENILKIEACAFDGDLRL
jgi:hypothetical protein